MLTQKRSPGSLVVNTKGTTLSSGKDEQILKEDGESSLGTTKEFRHAHTSEYNLYRHQNFKDAHSICGKGLRSIENMDELRWVSCLWLTDNAFENFNGLEVLSNLRSLYMQNNRLSSLKGVQRLKALVILDVSGNLISDIVHLGQLPLLTTLYINHNKLSTSKAISPLTLCPLLECVDLAYNYLEDMDALQVLSRIDRLQVLRLEGNAVTRLSWYRSHVIASCQKLTLLDQRSISHVDRVAVDAWCIGDKATEEGARRYWTTRRARQMPMGVTIVRKEMSDEVTSSRYAKCDSSHPDCRAEGRRGPKIDDWGDEPTKMEEKHSTTKQEPSGRRVTFGREVHIPKIDDWGDEPTKMEENHSTTKQEPSGDNMNTLALGRKVTFGGEVYIPQKKELNLNGKSGSKNEEGESMEAPEVNLFTRWRSFRSRCTLSKKARSKSVDGGKST